LEHQQPHASHCCWWPNPRGKWWSAFTRGLIGKANPTAALDKFEVLRWWKKKCNVGSSKFSKET
jgi:hypothetical protein